MFAAHPGDVLESKGGEFKARQLCWLWGTRAGCVPSSGVRRKQGQPDLLPTGWCSPPAASLARGRQMLLPEAITEQFGLEGIL